MDLDTLIRSLDLVPHPEGGFYLETFRSPAQVASPSGATRAAVTQILYALPAGGASAWHRVASDELWQHQGGAPLDLYVIDANDRLHRTRLGDVREGLAPQAVVPAGAWQAARVDSVPHSTGWALCGCTVAPGFEFEDFEIADAAAVEALAQRMSEPQDRDTVRQLGIRTTADTARPMD